MRPELRDWGVAVRLLFQVFAAFYLVYSLFRWQAFGPCLSVVVEVGAYFLALVVASAAVVEATIRIAIDIGRSKKESLASDALVLCVVAGLGWAAFSYAPIVGLRGALWERQDQMVACIGAVSTGESWARDRGAAGHDSVWRASSIDGQWFRWVFVDGELAYAWFPYSETFRGRMIGFLYSRRPNAWGDVPGSDIRPSWLLGEHWAMASSGS